jgi:LmbE family N-acetylglucosaminyl deacetylase
MMTAREQNAFVDVTDAFDRKLEALLCHVSQHQNPEGLEAMLHGWLTANAERAGLPAGRLAEAYLKIDTA